MEEGGIMQGESSSIRSDHFQKPTCQDFVNDDVIEKPKQGMEFNTYNALHDYYARYAKQEGFAVSKRTSKKGKNGKVKYVCVQCCRGGKPSNNGANLLKPRPQTRLDCPAKVRATFGANDKFILSFVEEFEDAWFEFISKYDLHSNSWLEGLYEERERWVPAFVKHMFWAGMSSTQRSESINSYFDGFINSRTTLKQFVEQYENALTKKVEIESQEDANSWKSFIPCISEDDELEKQFQSVYTNNKVRELQIEIRRILKFQIWTRSEDEYEIKEWIFIGDDENKRKKRVSFKVLFNEETNETQCNCRNFQFKGMVCAHQLIVWNDMGISKVPDKYVFRRWCKNVKRAHSKVQISYDKTSKRTEPCLTENMYKAFKDVVESVEDSKEKYEKVMTMCRELKQEFDDASGICVSNVAVETAPDDDCVLMPSNPSTTILDPEPVRRRGRPPFKRKVSLVEKISKARKRKVTVCHKAKGNMKKCGPSNEHEDVHQQTLMGTQHNVSTSNVYPSHMGPIICDPSMQNYVPSQISETWNIPQGGALDQLRQIEYWARSQTGPYGNSPPLQQTSVFLETAQDMCN